MGKCGHQDGEHLRDLVCPKGLQVGNVQTSKNHQLLCVHVLSSQQIARASTKKTRHLYKKVTFQKGQWCKSYNAISSRDCEGPMVGLEGWWKTSVGFLSFGPVTNPLPMFFLMEKKQKGGMAWSTLLRLLLPKLGKKG